VRVSTRERWGTDPWRRVALVLVRGEATLRRRLESARFGLDSESCRCERARERSRGKWLNKWGRRLPTHTRAHRHWIAPYCTRGTRAAWANSSIPSPRSISPSSLEATSPPRPAHVHSGLPMPTCTLAGPLVLLPGPRRSTRPRTETRSKTCSSLRNA
jgi:hypothetical protein